MYNPQIKTLICVADTGSFSKAAKTLFLSPVSIMNQINALEKRFGIKLFERTNHGVKLTEAGQSIYQDAKKIIRASDTALNKAKQIEGTKPAVIRIGTSILRPCKPLLDLWANVANKTSSFQIKIIPFDDNPANMTTLLESLGHTIDCFVSPCDSVNWEKHYSIQRLSSCKCCIAMPKRHVLAKKDHLTWSDLSGETLMLIKKGESPVLDCMRNEIETNHPDIHIADLDNFYDMDVFNTCEQNGYLMEALDIWTDIHPSIITRPVEWTYEIPFGIIYAKKPSKSFKNFLKLVLANIKI